MSGYRRFIAYVYEYTYGKKGNGRGFIRVEARDGMCRMDYKLAGICNKEYAPAKIYGYVRNRDTCIAVLLGECDLAGSTVQFTLEMPQINMGESSYGLGDIKGLIILCESGEMYGSGWDDKPINLEEIQFPQTLQPTLPKEKEKSEELWEDKGEEAEKEFEETEEEDVEEQESREEEEDREEQENMEEKKPVESREGKMEEIIETEVTETEEFTPFSDGSISECQRITPLDYQLLSKQDRGLLNNQFLRHGFSQYGHVLLGVRQKDNRHILGVPGIYERQEALMAGMLGFPYFKETGEKQKDGKMYGYWYRVVDTK